MSTFVYAPGIRVHIESQDHGIIDVSGDLTQWQLMRRTNSVSSFNFTLQNTQRKYDQVFRPEDRITVELKRITWVRVFTGTLNTGPVFSAWPRALPMSASCSLKKLQFWPWNPTTSGAVDLITKWVGNNTTGTSSQGDGGLKSLATDALVQVTNWNPQAIHFGQVPNNWFDWARSTEQLIDQAATMQSVLGSSATILGEHISVGSLFLAVGTYGGTHFNATQCGNAASIYAVVVGQCGISDPVQQDAAATMAIMCAMQESSLIVLDSGDRDSVGLYQQRPSQGWGTKAECMDITFSTKSFVSHLLSISGWNTMPKSSAIQAVQRSFDGSRYANWQTAATEMIVGLRAEYNRAALPQGGTSATGVASDLPSGQPGFKSTANNLAQVAYNLIASRPAGAIRYQEGNDDDPRTAVPTVLDCSSLVEWVYYHATGSLLNHRTSEMQYSIVQQIPVEIAAKIKGSLVFIVGPAGGFSGGDAGHVGVSLGGNKHVAAHTDQVPLAQQVTAGDPILGQFTAGGLLPGVDYSQAADDQTTADWLSKNWSGAAGKTMVATPPISGTANSTLTTAPSTTNSSLQQLVTVLTSNPVAGGDIFGGPRELMNNQQFLPWVKNVVNSSMRAFCSAPNGDFIAWFPDYFNIWGTAAIMNIRPIELQDFTVDWSDQQIVTHEFVIGSRLPSLDQTSGGVVDVGNIDQISEMLTSHGIATMDFPQIFKAIYGKVPSKKFINDYLTRFGARPNMDQMPNLLFGDQEFYMALWNFMYYWSSQFNATVPMTFMPELYPGMILRIPDYDFQCYVTDVTHSGSYGQNGGFTTQATVIAPARTSNRTDLFGMLPLAGAH